MTAEHHWMDFKAFGPCNNRFYLQFIFR